MGDASDGSNTDAYNKPDASLPADGGTLDGDGGDVADGGDDDWQLDEDDGSVDANAKRGGRAQRHFPLPGATGPRAPTIAPTSTPPGQQNPFIQSVGSLRLQRDGTHRWDVTFTLPTPTVNGGFVVQHLQVFLDVGDGAGLVLQDDFWESWMILPGQTRPAFDPNANANDEYYAGTVPTWHGTLQRIGTARFYEMPTLPVPPFNQDGTGRQATSPTAPDFWSGEGSVHDLSVDFDARPGGRAPRVTATPNDAPILRVRNA